MLTGSIAGLGSQYGSGLKAVNCQSGDLLAEAQEQAAGEEGVLKALDAAAVSLRGKLGESLSTVQAPTPLDEATRSSLEALKAYSLGMKTNLAKGDIAAIPFYKKGGKSLHRNFAAAYSGLSEIYSDHSLVGLAAEYAGSLRATGEGERVGKVQHRGLLLLRRDRRKIFTRRRRPMNCGGRLTREALGLIETWEIFPAT